jgi:hypothetical protein
MRAAPQLTVGMFEPRVVAQAGADLAVPLTPVGASKLQTMVNDLAGRVLKAANEALAAGKEIEDEDIVLPTPGMAISSHLGDCSVCGAHEEALQDARARMAGAEADAAEAEARRRQARLDANPPLLDEPEPSPTPLHVTVERAPDR